MPAKPSKHVRLFGIQLDVMRMAHAVQTLMSAADYQRFLEESEGSH